MMYKNATGGFSLFHSKNEKKRGKRWVDLCIEKVLGILYELNP